jgi:hypothetical protein
VWLFTSFPNLSNLHINGVDSDWEESLVYPTLWLALKKEGKHIKRIRLANIKITKKSLVIF